jgi:hypothetical protein
MRSQLAIDKEVSILHWHWEIFHGSKDQQDKHDQHDKLPAAPLQSQASSSIPFFLASLKLAAVFCYPKPYGCIKMYRHTAWRHI